MLIFIVTNIEIFFIYMPNKSRLFLKPFSSPLKYYSFLGFLVFLFCVGCNKEIPSFESLGNLEVKIISSDGIPEQNAVVKTEPSTVNLTTDITGKVLFNNIPVGKYKVIINLSPSSESFDPNVIYEVEGVEIIKGGMESILFTLIESSKPLEEASLDIDFLLSRTYNVLKEDAFYNSEGYSLYWGDIGADLSFINPKSTMQDFLKLDSYDISPSNQIIDKVWSAHYQAIWSINLALDAIKQSDYSSPSNRDENELQAEFRFLRALLYFNLVKLYGNPVLVTSSVFELDAKFLQDKQGVLNLIEDDLKFSENYLTKSKISETASVYAAQALLGKFYLYLGGFPNFQNDKYLLAINQFEKITGQFFLEENYSDVFSTENESMNSEIIFTIPFESGDNETGGNSGVRWGPLGYALSDMLLLDDSFVEGFFSNLEELEEPIEFPLDITDSRFQNNIASFKVIAENTENDTNRNNWRPTKFITDYSISPKINNSSENFPLLRYADVLLMLAEAENALNGPTQKAYEALNEVMSRSISNGRQLPDNLGQRDFLLEVLQQRRLELCFEGQYKDDLIRNELLETTILDFNNRNQSAQKQFDSHEYIWPIPSSEVNSNPDIIQNPGY